MRPMTYPGRILQQAKVADKEVIWQKSRLLLDTRTEVASQLRASDMDQTENCAVNALPETTEENSMVHGAPKYSQIGIDGCLKTFEALFANILDTQSSANTVRFIVLALSCDSLHVLCSQFLPELSCVSLHVLCFLWA